MRRIVLVVGIASLAGAVELAAQTNLARNPGFTAGAAPWTLDGGLAWSPTGGNAGPGSLHCTDLADCSVSQCIDLGALPHPQTIDYSIAMRHAGEVSTFSFFAFVYPNRTCSGFGQAVDLTQVFFPQQPWTVQSSSFSTFADTGSVSLGFTLLSSSPNAMDAYLDDAVVDATNGPLFLDGFEAGDTSEWSVTMI